MALWRSPCARWLSFDSESRWSALSRLIQPPIPPLAFTITPNAEWHLEQYHIRGLTATLTQERDLRYEGVIFGVGAIHRGVDATNRLAVLMRGSSYTFFVNGQFVGGYQAGDLPQTGQVGVYTEGLGDLVIFSGLGAIHTGEDASNRLAVLMDGSSYTFFINGQYVGGYLANDLPLAGGVGIYVESSGGLETFSDLLISPPPVSA